MAAAYLSSLIGFMVFYVVHLLYWRMKPSNSPRMLLMVPLTGFCIGVSLVPLFLLGKMDAASLYHALAMDFFLMISYVYFYAGICRSVSLTLLDMIRRNGNAAVPLEALIRDYEKSERFEDRLAVMRDMGWIDVEGRRVTLTRKGKNVSRFVQFVSFFVAQSGLEG